MQKWATFYGSLEDANDGVLLKALAGIPVVQFREHKRLIQIVVLVWLFVEPKLRRCNVDELHLVGQIKGKASCWIEASQVIRALPALYHVSSPCKNNAGEIFHITSFVPYAQHISKW